MSKGGVLSHGHAQRFSFLPSAVNQASFAVTGAFAGACTLPVEYAWQRIATTNPTTMRAHLLAAPVYRGAVRFWIFSVARSALSHGRPTSELPLALKGGLAGAAGGFSEILVQSALALKVPRMSALASQSSKLFFCFGSYTYLSTTLSETLPPRPFWKCWGLGAVAGALGSGIVGVAEGARGRNLVGSVIPKGAAVIGTVIAVQVTSCKEVLDRLEPVA